MMVKNASERCIIPAVALAKLGIHPYQIQQSTVLPVCNEAMPLPPLAGIAIAEAVGLFPSSPMSGALWTLDIHSVFGDIVYMYVLF
jgi:hypothetical protein